MAQVGFTRFEAVSPDIDGELEMGVRRAALAREISWLPAVENRGEGVFIQFRKDAVQNWIAREDVIARGNRLLAGYDAWKTEHSGATKKFVEAGGLLPYVLFSFVLASASYRGVAGVRVSGQFDSRADLHDPQRRLWRTALQPGRRMPRAPWGD